jgi:hypothetical protein
MRLQPEMLTLSVGPTGDKWYHLDGRLFPAHNSYAVPDLSSLGLTDFAYAVEGFQELGRALETNIESSCVPEEFAGLYGANRELWLQVARLWVSAGEAGELVAAA